MTMPVPFQLLPLRPAAIRAVVAVVCPAVVMTSLLLVTSSCPLVMVTLGVLRVRS